MAVQFTSASTQYLQVDSAIPGATETPLTMACWFKHGSGVVDSLMMHVDASEPDNYFLMLLDASDNVVASHRQDGSPSDATKGAFTADAWQHAGAVFVSTASRFAYLNGVAGTENTTLDEQLTGIDRFAIGAFRDSSPGGYYEGPIAEAAVWSVALTTAEMAILAAGYSASFVRPASLVFYDRMIRLDSGGDSHDIVGGLTMTGFNTPTTGNHPRIIRPSGLYVPAFLTAAPSGISIPIAMHHYKQMMGVN